MASSGHGHHNHGTAPRIRAGSMLQIRSKAHATTGLQPWALPTSDVISEHERITVMSAGLYAAERHEAQRRSVLDMA